MPSRTCGRAPWSVLWAELLPGNVGEGFGAARCDLQLKSQAVGKVPSAQSSPDCVNGGVIIHGYVHSTKSMMYHHCLWYFRTNSLLLKCQAHYCRTKWEKVVVKIPTTLIRSFWGCSPTYWIVTIGMTLKIGILP